ncbi:MAG TPA: GGDEF domain-containing protein [Candidatus Dormibacteraeota bacterium]|jgi:diguanylate cyclase (GGDEF)-like protein|nr:GGDEF domain-containing protein [Candidatus Dormibacteraeota bacterium]
MQRVSGLSRKWFAFGAGVVILAAAGQVGRARLPGWALLAEVLLFGFGAAYAVYAVRSQGRLLNAGPGMRMAMSLANLGLSTGVLVVAAPYVPEAMPFAFAVLLTTVIAAIMAGDQNDVRMVRPAFAAAGGVLGLGLVWVRLWLYGPQPVDQLLIWGGMLVGLGILIEVHWRIGRARLDIRLSHLAAMASASHRLGGTTDMNEVGAAILEAFVDTFPHLNWGGILTWVPEAEVLRSLPVALTPAGLVRPTQAPGTPVMEIRPGEGLAGEAFATGDVVYRRSATETRRDTPTRGEGQAEEIQRLVGAVRSAIAAPLRDGRGEIIGVVSMGSALSEYDWQPSDLVLARGLADQAGVAIERGRLYDEQRLRAITDHLTGLPNRREFERILAGRDPAAPFAVMAIDLDNLKIINDEHGHEAGDAVLRLVSTVIRAGLRTEDTVARVGGDEFAALLPATDAATAADIAERLTHSMSGVAVPFGSARISVGCAAGPPGADPREVWTQADEALYRAKAGGRNRVEISRSHGTAHGAPPRGRRWVELLPDILAERQIGSVYQPIVDLAENRVVGFEALARPEGQMADSSVEGLFAAALRMGLTRDLDWLCRRAAVSNARELGDGHLLFVNVGVPALLDPLHDVDQMLLLLAWAGRSARQVILELSEREAVTDLSRFHKVLQRYRDHGFRFALDDVGEGHSTIEVLATGAPEYIKIASSLTQGSRHPGRQAAIEALAAFARSSGSVLIAEGIETESERELMLSLGVELGQGYGLGRPQVGFDLPDPLSLPLVSVATA